VRNDPKSSGVTVDTPVPYRLADLVALIDERMGKLENRSSRIKYHKLITRMDDILDLIQDVAQSVYLYDVRKLTQEACHLSDICVSCCERVRAAVSLLNNMDNGPAILKTCEEIDRLESDADRAMRTGMAKLFREEQDARQLIKLKALYELLENVTDACEDVANIIEGIVLENS